MCKHESHVYVCNIEYVCWTCDVDCRHARSHFGICNHLWRYKYDCIPIDNNLNPFGPSLENNRRQFGIFNVRWRARAVFMRTFVHCCSFNCTGCIVDIITFDWFIGYLDWNYCPTNVRFGTDLFCKCTFKLSTFIIPYLHYISK